MKDKVKERVKEKDREKSGNKSKHSSPSVPESPRDGEFEKGTALKAALSGCLVSPNYDCNRKFRATCNQSRLKPKPIMSCGRHAFSRPWLWVA